MFGLISGMLGSSENLPYPTYVGADLPTTIGSGTLTRSLPAGVQAGDLSLVLIAGTANLVSVASVAGYSLVYTNATNNLAVFSKVLSAGETTYTYTANSTGFVAVYALAFRKAEIGNVGAVTESGLATSHSIPTVSTSRKNSLVLVHARFAVDSATNAGSSVTNPSLLDNPLVFTQGAASTQGAGVNTASWRSRAQQGMQSNTVVGINTGTFPSGVAISANTFEIRPIP